MAHRSRNREKEGAVQEKGGCEISWKRGSRTARRSQRVMERFMVLLIWCCYFSGGWKSEKGKHVGTAGRARPYSQHAHYHIYYATCSLMPEMHITILLFILFTNQNRDQTRDQNRVYIQV
jgi:hypothetical protein